MAKQNIDDQVVLNQSPDAFVVFLNLDETGVPIRDDLDNSRVIPDIDDIMSINLAMGSTGAIGRFTLTINNANNKYYIPDDMSLEIHNCNSGQVIVLDDEGNETEYNTHPTGVMWADAEEFLNNYVYRKMFSADGSPVINLYYQDASDKYAISKEQEKKLGKYKTAFLKKGIIKYRVIPENELEAFAKNVSKVSAQKTTTGDAQSIASTVSTDSVSVAKLQEEAVLRVVRENATEFRVMDELTVGPGVDEEKAKVDVAQARLVAYNDLIAQGWSADAAAAEVYTGGAISNLDSNIVETMSEFSPKYKDLATLSGGTADIRNVSLDEAILLLSNSNIQAAFFEKYGGQLEHGRCLFEPMQLCTIFLSRRFRNTNDTDDMIMSFTGYVDSVSDGFDGVSQILTITGSDVTKVMNITQANINPTLFTEKLPGDSIFKVWQNRFGGLEGWEIIKLLTVGGDLDKSTGGGHIYGAGSFEVSTNIGVVDQSSVFTSTTSQTRLLNSVNLSQEEASGELPDEIDRLFFSTKRVHIQILPFDTSPVGSFQSYDVFKKVFGMSFGNWQNDYVSHLEIAKQVAQLTNYEFYADAAGEIWYHQPRFHNYHILTNDDPDIYILRDEDILNCNLTESDEQVITSVYMVGTPDIYTGPKEPVKMVGFYEDTSLVLKYGRRMVSVSHPYVVSEGNIGYFARSYLIRANAARFVGQVTILGRPEIRMHMPVYIPFRNMVYYIEGIKHSYTMGEQFQTVLTLKYGRKPWEVLPEVLDYTSNIMHNQGSTKGKRSEHTEKDFTITGDEEDIGPISFSQYN